MTTPDPDHHPDHDPDQRARELAAAARSAGDATGWFERLYAAAEAVMKVVLTPGHSRG